MNSLKQWRLARRPVGALRDGDLDLVEQEIGELSPGQVLVRIVYFSLDPANRVWMSDQDQYMPPVAVGEPMRALALGVVERSASDRFAPGDVVTGMGAWATHFVADAAGLSPAPQIPGTPLTAHLSVLGVAGLTAWYGLTEIAQPQPGETVVVSAAAGAVGSLAGQIAKFRGARVIGIAGSAAKCRWLVEDLGFDAAINYKAEEVGAALDRHCPNGIDVDFENVGGQIMDAVVARMNLFGRMALCGMISAYNDDAPQTGPRDFIRVVMNRLTLRGFILTDFLPRAEEAMAELVPWVASGRLKWKVEVEPELARAPEALQRIFSGAHEGKLLVQVSSEP